MKLAVACDHGGLPLKNLVRGVLEELGADLIDLGTDTPDSVDYPDYAFKALGLLVGGECERCVLICGTGIGMSICANRVPGVRGTLCAEPFSARMARQHNDSNCLILGARVIGPSLAEEIVRVWMATPFEGGRHAQRLIKIEELARSIKAG